MCGGGICCLYCEDKHPDQCVATSEAVSEKGQVLVKLLPLQIIMKLANRLLLPAFVNSCAQRQRQQGASVFLVAALPSERRTHSRGESRELVLYNPC